jgi:hypothetical protein
MNTVPIYNSRGDVGAYLQYPHLYNTIGEWIGFCTREREVGYLSDDHRILRQRTLPSPDRHLDPPPPPTKINPPANVPLAPLMRELTHSTVDVLLEMPERLHTADMGELRQDLE